MADDKKNEQQPTLQAQDRNPLKTKSRRYRITAGGRFNLRGEDGKITGLKYRTGDVVELNEREAQQNAGAVTLAE